jgi:hypothetical protein
MPDNDIQPTSEVEAAKPRTKCHALELLLTSQFHIAKFETPVPSLCPGIPYLASPHSHSHPI